MSLPLDILPCLGGDVILIPRGILSARLSPEQRRELAAALLALDTLDTPEAALAR
ncbi:hypothetical protein OG589_35800 [Sphaerisporangium sp. NBC_01403]|uniref:hypothetical protein n=1 Tax=Sphaerisporangium sp. NBC_01403 TaxID=2903599 RepID=UPI00324A87E1